jgi:hypothetical protein
MKAGDQMFVLVTRWVGGYEFGGLDSYAFSMTRENFFGGILEEGFGGSGSYNLWEVDGLLPSQLRDKSFGKKFLQDVYGVQTVFNSSCFVYFFSSGEKLAERCGTSNVTIRMVWQGGFGLSPLMRATLRQNTPELLA